MAIIRQGTLAGAADALGLARSTVTQHVQSLEEALGVRLLERTTRKIRLTPEGTLLYEHMSAALGSWQEVLESFEGVASEPTGLLRVTSPLGLVGSLVAPVLAELANEHPDLEIDLIADDRVRDLREDGIDVAVRMGSAGDQNNVVRRVGTDERILVASPSFAANLDDAYEAVEQCAWVGHQMFFDQPVTVIVEGVERSLRPRYRSRGSSTTALLALVTRGLGVALLPSLLVKEGLETGALVHVCPSVRGREAPLFVLYPSRRLQPARGRVFVDRLAARLA